MNKFPFPRSTSQRRVMRSCGEQYRLQYGQGWKPKIRKGTYAFGDTFQDCIEQGLDLYHASGEFPDIAKVFRNLWEPLKDDTMIWTSRASHAQLLAWGQKLIPLALREAIAAIDMTGPMLYEAKINFKMGEDEELAIPDFIGWVYGPDQTPLRTILDWKTSDRAYNPLTVELDEQLTDYQLAVDRTPSLVEMLGGPIQQVGLVVGIYGVNPRVQWLLTPARSAEELQKFEESAATTNRLIREGIFARNTRACFNMGECAMIPLCYPSQRGMIEQKLVRQPREEIRPGLPIDEEGE